MTQHNATCKPHFLKSSVVVKWTYVTPVQTVQKIHKMRQTCNEAPYLDCVLEHAEVTAITREFSRMHRLDDIQDPEGFEQYVEECAKTEQT